MQLNVIQTAAAVAAIAFAASVHSAPAAPNAEKLEPGKVLVALFAQTCMSYATSLSSMAEMLDEKLKRIPPEHAAIYLEREEGAAWAANTPLGPFVVAVRGSNRCAVHSGFSDPDGAEKAFMQIVEVAKRNGLRMTRLQDEKAGAPRVVRSRTISYSAREAAAAPHLQISLSTTEQEASPIKATASLSYSE